MAIALSLDPAWTTGVTTASITTASFSPGANELIIIEFQMDFATTDTTPSLSVSNTGTALTWNAIGSIQRGVSNQSLVMAWWAYNTASQSGITATVTCTGGTTNRAKDVKITTFTGASKSGAVGSLAAGSSTTNNLTVTVTTGGADVRVMGSAIDFNSLGVPTSTDDETGFDTTDSSGVSVRKSTNTATSGSSVNINFDAAGSSAASWAYKVWEIYPYYSGSVALSVTLGIATTGRAKSQGSTNLGLTIGLAATGRRAPKGQTALSVTLGVAATGSAKAQGSTNLGLTMGIAATGDDTDTKGTVALNTSIELSATGIALSRIVPIRVYTEEEILTGNRSTKFYLDVLDQNDAPLFRLKGMKDGSLDWVANAVVKGGGQLTVVDVDESINWLTARLRPVMLIKGLPPQPLGIFLPAETPESWDNGRKWNIKLLDKTTILDQDTITQTYALAAGTVVTPKIVELIESAGITNHAITPSTAALAGNMLWVPGTSKIRIINDLLDQISYFSLYMNFDGQMVGEPYVLPAKRPLFYEFVDGPKSVYRPDFARDLDIYNIPNRVTLTGVGDGTTEALTSTQDNTDSNSPYSIANRGRVIGHAENGIEAVDQAALDLAAKRRLVDLTSPTSGVEIAHSPVPGLAVNMAARFRRQPANIDARHVISKTALTLDGKALATSTLREVINV